MTNTTELDMAVRISIERIIDRLAPLAVIGQGSELFVTGVEFDHRDVEPGSLFCCLVGSRHDSHDFAREARQRGAVAFICEHTLGHEVDDALQLVVGPGLARSAMALAACAFYGDPAASLRTVGITGTNGKTTTTYLLRAILEAGGWPTGVIGTLGGPRTTPEAPKLQAILADMTDSGVVACAMEVTSHAINQHRVDGICFDVAVFTNLSQEHLDYHKSMEAYFNAKSELFTPARARFAVVNRDDVYGRQLIDRSEVPTVSYSLEDARNLEVGLAETKFRLGKREVRLKMGGAYNVSNALAAASAARALGVDADAIVQGLADAAPVPGRFESFASEDGVVAIVDYAHTPSGLEEALRAARGERASALRSEGAVVVVFGCGGDRDRGKRPAMGEVAGRMADVVVLTTDNPRSEDPASIIDEIRAGFTGPADLVVELDRRAAIAGALRAAHPGDVIVIAGKGHESTQEFAHQSVAFDDREVVRSELKRINWRARRAQQDDDVPNQ